MKNVILAAMLALVATGCTAYGDPTRPLPVRWIKSPGQRDQLMIVLPGRADNLSALSRSGIAEAVQTVWRDSDVVLVELTLPYYIERLHEEVVVPARKQGYRHIWITGASMGGMGALMYDAQYPDTVDGLILLAPYLGEKDLIAEIEAAGGIRNWQAGAFDATTNAGFTRALWQHLQVGAEAPGRARAVWLAYGDRDRLRYAMPAFESLLPPEQVLHVKGGHSWSVWTPATRQILQRQVRTRTPAR